jgi:hypothetical protein
VGAAIPTAVPRALLSESILSISPGSETRSLLSFPITDFKFSSDSPENIMYIKISHSKPSTQFYVSTPKKKIMPWWKQPVINRQFQLIPVLLVHVL